MLDGTRLGNAIVDRLKAEGVLQVDREVHHFDVSTVTVGVVVSITFVGSDGAWEHTVTVPSASTDAGAVAGQLADAVAEDPIVSPYFEAEASDSRVTTTAKSPGQSFEYSTSGPVTDVAGEAIEDDESVRELWEFVAEEIIAEIQNHAEVSTSVTGTAATDGVELDLDPTDGVRDGEVLDDASVSGTGTGGVS